MGTGGTTHDIDFFMPSLRLDTSIIWRFKWRLAETSPASFSANSVFWTCSAAAKLLTKAKPQRSPELCLYSSVLLNKSKDRQLLVPFMWPEQLLRGSQQTKDVTHWRHPRKAGFASWREQAIWWGFTLGAPLEMQQHQLSFLGNRMWPMLVSLYHLYPHHHTEAS